MGSTPTEVTMTGWRVLPYAARARPARSSPISDASWFTACSLHVHAVVEGLPARSSHGLHVCFKQRPGPHLPLGLNVGCRAIAPTVSTPCSTRSAVRECVHAPALLLAQVTAAVQNSTEQQYLQHGAEDNVLSIQGRHGPWTCKAVTQPQSCRCCARCTKSPIQLMQEHAQRQ